MIQGEPWRYVDSDPAFGAGWENAGTMSDLAFRAINGGTEVRLYGAILDNGAAAPVTTLPDGYRPEADMHPMMPMGCDNTRTARLDRRRPPASPRRERPTQPRDGRSTALRPAHGIDILRAESGVPIAGLR